MNAHCISFQACRAPAHLWIKPFGSWADLNSNGGAPGIELNVGGMAFGLDRSFNDRWVLGTAFVYAKADTHNSVNSARQSLTTDIYQLVGYGTYHLGDNTDLSFQIDGDQNRNDGKRFAEDVVAAMGC